MTPFDSGFNCAHSDVSFAKIDPMQNVKTTAEWTDVSCNLKSALNGNDRRPVNNGGIC